MTGYSTHGWTITHDVETALGTQAGNPSNFRINASPTLPATDKLGVDNPNVGRAHPHDKSDKPIYYEAVREGGLSFEAYIRRAAADDGTPPIVRWLESAGCAVSYGDETLCASGCTTSSIVLDDDDGAQGRAMIIEDSTGGLWWPTLFASYTSGTKTGIATMDLPNAPADGNDALACFTVIPCSRQVPTTKTLTFDVATRGYYDGGDDLSLGLSGCSLNDLGTIVIEPNTPVKVSPSFHVSDVSHSDNDLAVETFADGAAFSIPDCNFHAGFSSADADGDITRASLQLLRAEIDLALSTTPMPTVGGTTCVNSNQGFMAHCGEPTVTITVLADANMKTNYLDLLTSSSNTSRYLHLIQPSTTNTSASLGLAWGFWFPNIHMVADDAYSIERFGDTGYQTITVKYKCSTSDFDADALNINNHERAPWYFGICGPAEAS